VDIIYAIKEIAEDFQNYYGGEHLLVIFVFCLLLAYLCFPELKRIVLYPTLMITFLLINPLLYQKIFHRIIFWRLLWMIPSTVIVAYVFCQLIRTGTTIQKKTAIVALMCLLTVFSGNYVYENVEFQKTQNLEKIDSGVKSVGKIIMKHCENPKCLLRSKYLSQIRQYSTDIELLYGRNVYNYITGASDEYKRIADEMEKKEPDYAYILEIFKANQCNVIAVRDEAPIPEGLLRQYDLYEISREDESIIYKSKQAP